MKVLSYPVSTDDKGVRYLSVFDNEGNLCTYEYGDTIDNVADRAVNATFTVPAASFVILTF